MMRPGRRRAAILLAALATFALARPAVAQVAPDTIDVLFLGNSYIYVNDLPALVEAISGALPGPIIRTGIHTHGGFTLAGHLEDGHVPAVLEPTAAAGAWDRVVLQEQSALGTDMDPSTGKLGEPTAFHAATRRLVEMIRQRGGEPLLYMTWAKERFPAQTADLAGAYEAIGAELGVPVAPVGLAWARVRRERPDLTLFLSDGSHPHPRGSYLAACVIYAELTGRSPVGAPREIRGMPWNFVGVIPSDQPTVLVSLDEDVAEYLQRVAWETVQEQR